jgi:hypothetical protein
MDETGRKTHKWRRRLLIAAVAVVLAAAAFVLSIPFLLTHVPIPVLEFDASPYLKGKAAEVVSSKKATADIDIMREKRYAAKIREKIPAGSWYQDDAGKWQQKK